jgi:8-oxo-dGTP pyrophosphatase MutT (NUDIX family)
MLKSKNEFSLTTLEKIGSCIRNNNYMTVLVNNNVNMTNNGVYTESYYGHRQKLPVFCANCGGMGHIYKNCNHPVTSYGIICYRLRLDEASQCIYPEYLLVQRKDSLSFVEFIRGKYDLDRRIYIMQLFENMTESERNMIGKLTFEELWKALWQVSDFNVFEREYAEAKTKFEILRKGYILRTDAGDTYFNIKHLLENTKSKLEESEWGFPKGRRNINEHDFVCAVREFSEETGMKQKYMKVYRDQKPFEEVFSGSNKVRYRHVYYLATCTCSNDKVVFNRTQETCGLKEIKDVQWFRYSEGQSKIRDQNIERKELFKRVNQIVLKNLCVK